MNEKLIEKKLREKVKKLGGIALKFFSPYFTGIPDRIVLMPGGKISFAELKTTGKKPTPRQVLVISFLRKLGFWVEVIDSQELLDEYLKKLENDL
jgi:VRR-NUC domain.